MKPSKTWWKGILEVANTSFVKMRPSFETEEQLLRFKMGRVVQALEDLINVL